MRRHFKKFILTGVLVLLTNIFWDSISKQVEKIPFVQKSMQFVADLFEQKEPPFNAIGSLKQTHQKLTLLLKEESFVYLIAKQNKESKLLFPNTHNSFNQYNPHIPYDIVYEGKATKCYLVASRKPLKINNIDAFLKELEHLKGLGRIDFLEL